jgi:hypothetical protein
VNVVEWERACVCVCVCVCEGAVDEVDAEKYAMRYNILHETSSPSNASMYHVLGRR